MQEESPITPVIKIKSTFLTKAKNLSITIVLIMLSLGQWNDTKDAIVTAYEEVISRFTNQIEYNRISKLRIGFTEQYTEEILGSPQVIKSSKLEANLQYYYYNTNKFSLITFIKEQRLAGFTIISKNNDFFAPVVYINKKLNTLPIKNYISTQDNFSTETGSLEYFAEMYELPRNLMFYNLSLGHINYSKAPTEYSKKITEVNDIINTGEDFDLSTVSFTPPLIPNFYTITELSNEVIYESLLSNYEMSTLFGNQD